MDTPQAPQFLTQVLAEITEPLYRSLDQATDIAAGHFENYGMVGSEYQAGQSHLARAHARRLLIERAELAQLGAWSVALPGPNVQVCLNREALQLRLLRPDRGTVPRPGPNTERIAWFSNRHAHLFGIEASRLIGLWELDGEGEVVVRVVRTVCEARFGRQNTIDIDIALPRTAGDVGQLEFRPFDDGEIELPFEQTGDDESAGGTGS